MSDEIKEINELKLIKENLEKEVSRLRVQELNLKASINAESLRLEAQKKLDELDVERKSNVSKLSFANKEERLTKRESAVHASEEALRNRTIMVEKREQEHLNLENRYHQLNKERSDFESMKKSMRSEIDKMKEEKAHLEGKESGLKAREDGVRGREKALVQKEQYYQDRMGEFTEWEKRVKKQIEHLEGLKKELQYVE